MVRILMVLFDHQDPQYFHLPCGHEFFSFKFRPSPVPWHAASCTLAKKPTQTGILKLLCLTRSPRKATPTISKLLFMNQWLNSVTISWKLRLFMKVFKFMSFWLQNYHEFEYCADELSYEFEYSKFSVFKLKFMTTGRIHAERCPGLS